ncbi:hypothetical protein G2583_pO550051 (plasmid) [Escherichia coli O55:H7 str. CB9615]|nr:hypothetical protein G2583_pO550051 [Escherichia coli O55:H7 str. CB9615]
MSKITHNTQFGVSILSAISFMNKFRSLRDDRKNNIKHRALF